MLSSNNNSDNTDKAKFFSDLEKSDEAIVDANSLELNPDDLATLINILKKHKNVMEINLNLNELGNSVIEAITILAKNNLTLKTIRCQYNDINDDGVSKLIQAAEDNPKILDLHIDLACNKITDKSLNNIAKFSPATILSAVSGNFIKDFKAIENLQNQAKSNYPSNKRKASQAFFSDALKNESKNEEEEDKIKVIQNQIAELSPKSIQKLLNYLDEHYKTNTVNKNQIKG